MLGPIRVYGLGLAMAEGQPCPKWTLGWHWQWGGNGEDSQGMAWMLWREPMCMHGLWSLYVHYATEGRKGYDGRALRWRLTPQR